MKVPVENSAVGVVKVFCLLGMILGMGKVAFAAGTADDFHSEKDYCAQFWRSGNAARFLKKERRANARQDRHEQEKEEALEWEAAQPWAGMESVHSVWSWLENVIEVASQDEGLRRVLEGNRDLMRTALLKAVMEKERADYRFHRGGDKKSGVSFLGMLSVRELENQLRVALQGHKGSSRHRTHYLNQLAVALSKASAFVPYQGESVARRELRMASSLAQDGALAFEDRFAILWDLRIMSNLSPRHSRKVLLEDKPLFALWRFYSNLEEHVEFLRRTIEVALEKSMRIYPEEIRLDLHASFSMERLGYWLSQLHFPRGGARKVMLPMVELVLPGGLYDGLTLTDGEVLQYPWTRMMVRDVVTELMSVLFGLQLEVKKTREAIVTAPLSSVSLQEMQQSINPFQPVPRALSPDTVRDVANSSRMILQNTVSRLYWPAGLKSPLPQFGKSDRVVGWQNEEFPEIFKHYRQLGFYLLNAAQFGPHLAVLQRVTGHPDYNADFIAYNGKSLESSTQVEIVEVKKNTKPASLQRAFTQLSVTVRYFKVAYPNVPVKLVIYGGAGEKLPRGYGRDDQGRVWFLGRPVLLQQNSVYLEPLPIPLDKSDK